MKKLSKNSAGFAALEGLLILIIVAIIGGTGWYVWHSKKETRDSANPVSSQSVEKTIDKTNHSTLVSLGNGYNKYTNKSLGLAFVIPDELVSGTYGPINGKTMRSEGVLTLVEIV